MAYKDILANGIRVITEPMPHLYSVATGIWCNIGSINETPLLGGVSHFLEHMLFKGTKRRDAREIAQAMEAVGGQMNAFTSKEYTCYYTKCLAEHFGHSVDLLSDLYLCSLLDEEEFSKEKGVILEEINMYEDAPDDLVHDLLAAAIWGGHAYGRPIIGSKDTVSSLSAGQLQAYYRTTYQPESTIIAVAGNVTREEAVAAAEKYFGSFTRCDTPKNGLTIDKTKPSTRAAQTYIYKDIEQVHLCLGFPAPTAHDEDRYVAKLLAAVLGGCASSRLFQEAREKRGLTYSIFSHHISYDQAGCLAAYASASPGKIQEVARIMLEQFADIAAHGPTEEEIENIKKQSKGNMLLGMESSGSMMNRLGRDEAVLQRVVPLEETLAKVNAVDGTSIQRLAQDIFQTDKLVLALVGPEKLPQLSF
ncbi:MAG: insulinase family protein [Clostridiales bacterium]|nr:insulinase family protein [Clostridiales bacterium]